MSEQELPPNIEEYLENIDDNVPVEIRENEELVAKVIANTGLTPESAKIIVQSFFQEIRNQILKGNTVIVKSFGKLSISSPQSGTKKKVFISFKPFKNLIRKLNDR